MGRLSQFISLLTGQKKGRKFLPGLILSAFGGFLLSLSFPLADIFPLAWISLSFIIIPVYGASVKTSWFYGFVSGMTFWLFFASWMSTFHSLSLVTAIPYLSIYFSLPFLILNAWNRITKGRFRYLRPLVFSIAWIGFEYLRCTGFLAFTWGVVGYSQYRFLPVIQIADIFGVWGVSFLVVFINASLAELIIFINEKGYTKKDLIKKIAPAAIMLFVAVVYGFLMLSQQKPKPTYKIALVQPDVDPAAHWQSRSIAEKTMEKIETFSKYAADQGVDLIIWSETLMARKAMFFYKYYKDAPGDNFYRKMGEWFRNLPEKLKTDMLLTAPHKIWVDKTNEYGKMIKKSYSFNSAFYINKKGVLLDRYDKIHLVPFGEWFPYKKELPFMARLLAKTIASDFTPGKRYVVFKSKKARFAAVICFEDIFGYLCRKFILYGADFLINTTNDYWSRSIASQEQHFAMAVLRAVENRRYMVRAANTGVSCIIDAWGRVESRLENHQQSVLIGKIPLLRDKAKPVYTHWGDWFALLSLYALLILVLFELGYGVRILTKKFIKKFANKNR